MLLDSFVEIEKEKIDEVQAYSDNRRQSNLYRQTFIFHGINFYLDQAKIESIQQTQLYHHRFQISLKLLWELYSYVLKQNRSNVYSGLTFSTYYSDSPQETIDRVQLRRSDRTSYQAIVRSVIYLDGQIFQQIHSDCLQNAQFAKDVTSAHYCLIESLLSQLNLTTKYSARYTWLSWLISFSIAIACVFVFLQPLTLVVQLLACLSIFLILQNLIKRLLFLLFKFWYF